MVITRLGDIYEVFMEIYVEIYMRDIRSCLCSLRPFGFRGGIVECSSVTVLFSKLLARTFLGRDNKRQEHGQAEGICFHHFR